jgi:hypothetical protein
VRKRGIVSRSLIALALIMASGIGLLVSAQPAAAATCSQQNGVSVSDPNTGWYWTTRWICGNSGGARMYGDARGDSAVTAYMDSTTSWFVCYRRGQTHAGGNDVWYYSLGDRAGAGQSGRSKWGYMPAVNLTTSIDPAPGMPACPQAYSPPQRVDGLSTVLFVHGYQPTGATTCTEVWGDGNGGIAKDVYRSLGYSSAQLRTIGYYTGDTQCDAYLPGTADRNTPIEVLANRLAWFIYQNYSQYGVNVDLVAHSMGGLIASVAISGTQHPTSDPFNNTVNAFSWPPYIYVQDVSTLNTPFQGATQDAFCSVAQNTTQCREMSDAGGYQVNGIDRPNFLAYWIKNWGNPQAYYLNGRGGTDWTLIGSSADWVVGEQSALQWSNPVVVGHKVLYVGGGGVNQPLGHSDLYKDPLNGIYHQYYCDWYNTSQCDQSPDYCLTCPYWGNLAGWNYNSAALAPIVVARNANWYADGR